MSTILRQICELFSVAPAVHSSRQGAGAAGRGQAGHPHDPAPLSSDLSFHPHWHITISDGVFTPEGDFIPLWNWNIQALLEDLRASILRAFVRWCKLSPETARSLQEWELERAGFSCFLSPAIPEADKEGLGRLIRYLFRSPVSYRQLSGDTWLTRPFLRPPRGLSTLGYLRRQVE